MAIINGIITAYIALTLPLVIFIAYKVYSHLRYPEKKEAKSAGMQILEAIALCTHTCVSWLTNIANSQDVLKRDNQAMLQATKAIAQSMLDIKGIAEEFSKAPTPEKSIERFVNTLEYARDKFAQTPTQKKTVQSIITNIRTNHGTKSK